MHRLLMSLYISLALLQCHAQTMLTYPNIDGVGENGIGYQVLKLALKKSGDSYTVRIARPVVNQDRALALLESGQLDVVDTAVDPQLEKKFEPIYRPMDRGILGWRIFIVHRDNVNSFAQVRDINDLKKYVAGQGINWPDVAVLEHSGIRVLQAAQIENLFTMAQRKRFDFLPLGANEAYGFLKLYGKQTPALQVEQSLVVVYPFANLFYLRKGNAKLRRAIEQGMDDSLQDGELQKLLASHPMFRDAFGKAGLEHRKPIRIDNPNLPSGLLKIDPKWWYFPIVAGKPS